MLAFSRFFIGFFIATLFFVGCSSGGATEGIGTAESKLQRNISPDINDTQLRILAAENNAFAFDMFASLQASERDNLFFSPYSISEALVMTYAGAVANTKSQMAAALHFDLNDTLLHNSFNALDLHLNYTDTNYAFSIANSLWAQNGYEFVSTYLDTIKENYGAAVNLVDFQHETEKARLAINGWVEDKTQHKIQNLIPDGMLSTDTKLVLTNAVYFKALWMHKFEETSTHDGPFTLLDGSTKQTAMMHQLEGFAYIETDMYQAIDLPYQGGRTSMLVILPKEGQHEKVVENISDIYAQSLADMRLQLVDFKLPKFKFTTKLYALKSHFQTMGMIDAFNESADFSSMSISSQLMIAEILHKAFISVDEEGTEAAAATAVVMVDTAAPIADTQMIVDRPFIFLIKDQQSDQILFAGVFKEPI